jgi:hypothetical protein
MHPGVVVTRCRPAQRHPPRGSLPACLSLRCAALPRRVLSDYLVAVDADAEEAGHLDGLTGDFQLARAEMVRLAVAYAFERPSEEFVTLPA